MKKYEPCYGLTPTCGEKWMGHGQDYLTNGSIEGLNNKIQGLIRKAYGYRNKERFKTAIFFHLGGLDLYPFIPPNKISPEDDGRGEKRISAA